MRGQITIGASGDIYGVVTTHILLFWELECRPTEAAKWWEPMPIDSVSLNEAVAVSLSRSEFDTQSAIVSMAEALIKRAQEEARVDTGIDFQDASLYRAQTERGKLLNFKERNADTTSVLAKARAALDWVETHLTSMKTNLQNITSGSTTEERAAAAADYDTLIGDINSEISGATQLVNNIPTNLVGRPSIPGFSTDDVYAPISPTSGSVRVEGQFLGADFVIEDSSGYLWHRDEGQNAFVQYVADGTGTPTGTTISLDGLNVSSYDSSTGAVTLDGAGSLTGTLQKQGVGVLTSDYHNGFASDDDVTAAIAEVEAALSTLSSQGALIEAQASLVEGSISALTGKIDAIEDEIDGLIDDQIDETAARQSAADLKLRLALNNINLLSAGSKGLVENIVIAAQGLAPAPGVFGTLGY